LGRGGQTLTKTVLAEISGSEVSPPSPAGLLYPHDEADRAKEVMRLTQIAPSEKN